MSDDCQDIDECSTTPDICDNGRCINTEGSYKCDCYPGFKRSPDGSRCIGLHCLNFMIISKFNKKCLSYFNNDIY